MSPSKLSDPVATYRDRRAARTASAEGLRGRERLFSWLRLALALLIAVVIWRVFVSERFGWPALLPPLALFVLVAVVHERTVRRRRRFDRAAEHYRRGLDRIAGRWRGEGPDGTDFLDPDHPYAQDLDVFGPGSLYQLLCRARTVSGERELASWLSAPAAPAEVRARQEAVEELRSRLDFREALAVAGEEVGAAVHPDALSAWARQPPVLTGATMPLLAALLGVSNTVTLYLWLAPMFAAAAGESPSLIDGSAPFLVSILASLALLGVLGRKLQAVLSAGERPARELSLLAALLAVVEEEQFSSTALATLRARLLDGGRASRSIARLARLIEINEYRLNAIFNALSSLLLLHVQLAWALDRWRSRHGEDIVAWLAAAGRAEALSSLAGQAYENPEDPFPEIVEQGPLYDGRSLGHPLLFRADCVTNDLALDGSHAFRLVSGSNMSGKSTFLRTVGVNLALALAGAPVRAASLRVSPLAVGACMRVQDSLEQGVSHFYAEIRRLRRIVELEAAGLPVLFLLDEILHGTNSHDRRIGAEALIRGLLERGGVGLVTTHDLALAKIADDLGEQGANVHFADELVDGEIRFDYTLRPGVVRRSNALDLMRSIGLDV